ncbi:MAG: ATP-binding region [Candidatus Methanofastidiosum methylothiophilum]|uniref:ATP-binding region n=1 Tax=Candidatus Methanofastidiosum methylothiophilum TaxID=1705564 RepID=A0A150IUX1_9EURY|nr:MAG: ATP-binding region [Candidatus Methanofastidiosum methylthiophilus]KYC48773.1 MAG: ATP-binding region [Candidatus Methanofastidiosum methylthiophilus]KYC51421.1 MAG: ATP-binding region [Candidatus Methanofastidiosum methylthiophilus]
MRLMSLFSGGKDSLYAAYLAIKEGHEVVSLLSLESEREDSYMFHVPNISLTSFQAKAMGIPLIQKKVKGEKEKEVIELYKIIGEFVKNKEIDGIITGAIESNYQRERIQKIADDYGIFHYAPLWKTDTNEYMESLISNGFKAIIVSVSALGLDESYLGKVIDLEILSKLKILNKKYGVHAAGEGGEYETFVIDAPIFKKKLIIEKSRKIMENLSGVLVIDSVSFEDKS